MVDARRIQIGMLIVIAAIVTTARVVDYRYKHSEDQLAMARENLFKVVMAATHVALERGDMDTQFPNSAEDMARHIPSLDNPFSRRPVHLLSATEDWAPGDICYVPIACKTSQGKTGYFFSAWVYGPVAFNTKVIPSKYLHRAGRDRVLYAALFLGPSYATDGGASVFPLETLDDAIDRQISSSHFKAH